ncbi:hypothetical protein GQ53DRAFT_644865, partial [Thozetella sp. PMI_491]
MTSISSQPTTAPPSTKHGPQDWERLQPVIRRLYWFEGRELSEVMQTMEKDYGFVASEKQYKTYFKRWRLKKNVTADEMKAIARVRSRRLANGKQTDFWVRGKPVPDLKIDRFISR